MQVLCGQCGKTIEVEQAEVAATIICPECEHEIVVPRFDQDVAPEGGADESVYELPAEDEGFADQVKEAMSRKVQVVCGSCNRSLSVSARLAGKNARCPACGVKIRIPYPDEEAEEAELEHVVAAESEQTEQLDAASAEAEFARSQIPPRQVVPQPAGPSRTFWVGVGSAAAAAALFGILIISYVVGPEKTGTTPEGRSAGDRPLANRRAPVPPVSPPAKTQPVKPPPKPPAKPTLTVLAEAFDDFAANGYIPARLGQTYWHITANVKAGEEPMTFRTYGADVTLTVAGKPLPSLGTRAGPMAPPLPGRKRTVALPPNQAEKLTFVFEVPITTETATFKVGDLPGVEVKASGKPQVPPGTDLAGLYQEAAPRNLKPLLRDPVMRAIQAAPDQKMYIHSRSADQFQVAIPAAGVLGMAKPAAVGVYQAVLSSEDNRLPCTLRSCADGRRIILYLRNEPFHQITYVRTTKGGGLPRSPRSDPTLVRTRPPKPGSQGKPAPKPTTTKKPTPRPATRKSRLPKDHGKKTIFDF